MFNLATGKWVHLVYGSATRVAAPLLCEALLCSQMLGSLGTGASSNAEAV